MRPRLQVELWVDGAELSVSMPMEITIGRIGPGDQMFKKVSFTPMFAGAHTLFVALHSNELAVSNAFTIEVEDDSQTWEARRWASIVEIDTIQKQQDAMEADVRAQAKMKFNREMKEKKDVAAAARKAAVAAAREAEQAAAAAKKAEIAAEIDSTVELVEGELLQQEGGTAVG